MFQNVFRRPWYFAACITLCLLLYAFWPSGHYMRDIWEKKSNLTPKDIIPVDVAEKEVKNIQREIVDSGTGYNAVMAYKHKMRLMFLARRLPALHDQIVNTLRMQTEALSIYKPPGNEFSIYKDEVAASYQMAAFNRMLSSEEYTEIIRWSPTVLVFHHEPLFAYWAHMWWRIMLLAACYYIFIMLDRGLKLQYEALMPLWFFLACAFPPIGLLVYPTRDPAKQLGRAVQSLSWLIAMVLSFGCAGAVKAQSKSKQEKNGSSEQELVVSNTTPETPETKPQNTLTLWLFGDATGTGSHDRQVIVEFDHKTGFSVIQQNRQTSDRASAGGNITAGWTLRPFKQLKVTATAGPAFNYVSGKNWGGYNHQLQAFVITSLTTRYFRLANLVKFFLPTDEQASFGHRQIQTIRGPTKGTPRLLRGVGLEIETWRAKTPAGYRWNEIMTGPVFNVGEVFGKKTGFWNRISIYPYRDWCRPQPGHRRLWDIRIQYQHTFAFGR